ncbi:MAG: TonB family protein [Bacteroidetes bacterium]|nr:TonB family protein [Bacteroidota bacterium]
MIKHIKILFIGSMLICFSFIAFSQENVKLKTVRIKDKPNLQVYHVLRADKQIKHGQFTIYKYDRVKVSGWYKYGKKDSLWTNYLIGKRLRSKGVYKTDQKTGVWEYYDLDGELEQKYDHSGDELLFDKDLDQDTEGYNISSFAEDSTIKVDRAAVIIGGQTSIVQVMMEDLHYPSKAREEGIQGKVIISFMVDEKGMASSYAVKKGIGGGCDEEALRVMSSMSARWVPAIYRNQPIRTEFNIPINFSLK